MRVSELLALDSEHAFRFRARPVRGTLIDQAEQVPGRGHHQLQRDRTGFADQHLRGFDRQRVARMQLLRDLRMILCRPVADPVEAHVGGGAEQPEQA